jgi:hypothetical protein
VLDKPSAKHDQARTRWTASSLPLLYSIIWFGLILPRSQVGSTNTPHPKYWPLASGRVQFQENPRK